MSEPSLFRHYQIVQDAEGNNVELARSAEQVAVLAFDNDRLEFVHCHVLLEPLKNKAAFEDAAQTIQRGGHPLLAALVDYGEDDGNPFYITSNVDGENLRGYLQRHSELPLWLAAMLATRSLDAAVALADRGDFVTEQPLESFRLIQTGASALQVMVADYRLADGVAKGKSRLVKANFERQAKFLRTFLKEQGGGPGPALPDTMVSAVDFGELLGGTLSSGGPGLTGVMGDLRNALLKMVPEHLAGEIPTSQKPRALVAPLLATYQEVARGVVNLVRIQSQRLDMANPYSMRGTHTRSGRAVLVEQVPPARLCGKRVLEADKAVQKLNRRREITALLSLPLVNDAEGLACLAEEAPEGIPLAEILRERGGLGVAEVYVVLAGADAALTQLEKSGVGTRKLRLEDVFLLSGFGRDDPRTARLLSTKLNEWPSFTVMLRAHPTLAAMACRGTNIGCALPPASLRAGQWHGGWLSCLGKMLLINGTAPADATRDSAARLFDEEIARALDSVPASRSDVLARFVRVIQHYDLVAPPPISASEASRPKSREVPKHTAPPLEAEKQAPGEAALPISPVAAAVTLSLPTLASDASGDESVGFAELLFQSKGGGAAKPDTEGWGKGASEAFDSGEVGGWNEGSDPSPWWLKASVFIGGSMVVGAFLAQLSGHAIWQRGEMGKPVSTPAVTGKSTPGKKP